mgnify:CR=1 FL=1
MTITATEKVEMTTSTNQRLVTILLVLLIVFVALLILGIIAGWLWMGGMTLAPGASAGVGWGGISTNDMSKACADMMRNFQTP